MIQQWRQLFEIAGYCLNDDRYCILLGTPWAYTVEASIAFVLLLVMGFAFLTGKVAKLMERLR